MQNRRNKETCLKVSRWIASSLFFLLIFAIYLRAFQNTPPPEKSDSVYTLRVYQDLVIVDVVVTDKSGKPVKGLHKEDFKVLEDKAPQQISTFDFEDLSLLTENTEGTSNSVAPQKVVNLSETAPEQLSKEVFQNRRLMILMLDLSSMPVEDQIQAQKAAQDFIEKQMTPADLVAVVSNSSNLKLLQNFTNDREVLSKAVRQFVPGEASGLAERGTADPDAADAIQEDQSNPFVADETQFNIFNTDRKLSAIESVGKMFASLPGKKFLVHFSSGIEQTGTENQSQLRSTIDVLNQSNTSLYTVDARGLIAAPPGGDASKGSASGNANYNGGAIRSQMASISDSQETLTTLALDTGGKALQDTNDLGQVFQSVREDSGSYYLLGYYSSNTRRDGRFRQIKVQLNSPGLRVKSRNGYYAAKSFEQFSKSDKERQLEEAVTTDRPFSDLPFLVSANFVKSGSQQVFVPIGLRFSAMEIPLEGNGKKAHAEFDFIGQIRSSENRVVSAIRDTVRVQLNTEAEKKPKASEIQYTTGFYLKPGQYQMKFLLRENQTGKLSTFEQPLPVPDFKQKKLSMSSIILSNRLEPVDQKNNAVKTVSGFQTSSQDPDPLRVDDRRIIPSVARVFSSKDNLYIFFQTYLTGQRESTPNLSQSLLFLKDGELFHEAASSQINQFDESSRDTATSNFSIPLATFPKGQYILQVTTVDRISQESLIQRVSFVVR